MIDATFGHVNVIARDWRTLARFSTEIVVARTKDGRFVTWTYLTDPEGNIIELQAWSDTAP